MGRRAQRIPSWPGVIHSNKGRIHLRRPTCDILTIRLRRSGGPYIPGCASYGRNPTVKPLDLNLFLPLFELVGLARNSSVSTAVGDTTPVPAPVSAFSPCSVGRTHTCAYRKFRPI